MKGNVSSKHKTPISITAIPISRKIDSGIRHKDIELNEKKESAMMPSSENAGQTLDIDFKKQVAGKYQKIIQALISEKDNLVKRLATAKTEVTKANSDKVEKEAQILSQREMANELSRQIEKIQNQAKVKQKNLQEELNYEKEFSFKHKYDIETTRIKSSNLEQEIIAQKEELKSIIDEIDQMNIEIARLESDISKDNIEVAESKENLSISVQNISAIENKLRDENLIDKRLKNEKSQLEKEKSQLIQRMNVSSTKYEEHVKNLKQEKLSQITKLNKSKKMLVTHLMFLLIMKKWKDRITYTIRLIQENKDASIGTARKLIKLIYSIEIFHKYQKKVYFTKMRCVCLNYKNEMNRRKILLEQIVDHRQKSDSIREWYNQVNLFNKIQNNQLNGVGMIIEVIRKRLLHNGRAAFGELLDKIKFNNLKEERLGFLMNSYDKQIKRMLIFKWRNSIFSEKFHQGLELTHKSLSETKMKQSTYYNFRNMVHALKFDKMVTEYLALKTWKRAHQKGYINEQGIGIGLKMENFFSRLKTFRCIEALKTNFCEKGFEKSMQKMNEKITHKNKMNGDTENSIITAKNSQVYHCLLSMSKKTKDMIYSFFEYWKRISKNHKKKLKLCWIFNLIKCKWKVRACLNLWRKNLYQTGNYRIFTDQNKLSDYQKQRNNDLILRTNLFQHEVVKLNKKKDEKVTRIKYIIDRLAKIQGFRVWAKNSFTIKQYDYKFENLFKYIRKYVLKRFFKNYQAQISEIKKDNGREIIVRHFLNKNHQNTLKSILYGWKKYINNFLLAKAGLEKMMNSITKIIFARKFLKWHLFVMRTNRANLILTQQMIEHKHNKGIEELHEMSVVITGKVSVATVNNDSYKKLLLLAILVANRKGNALNQGKAICIWKDKINRQNKIKIIIQKYTKIFESNLQNHTFKKWKEFIYFHHFHEQSVSASEEQRILNDKLKELGASLSTHDEYAQKLTSEFEYLSKETNILNTRMLKAEETICLKKQRYISNSLLTSCFIGWKQLVEKKKDLYRKVISYSSKFIISNSFVNIRNQQIENESNIKRIKCIENLFRIQKVILLREGMTSLNTQVRRDIFLKNAENIRQYELQKAQIESEIQINKALLKKNVIKINKKKQLLIIFKRFRKMISFLKEIKFKLNKATISTQKIKQIFSFHKLKRVCKRKIQLKKGFNIVSNFFQESLKKKSIEMLKIEHKIFRKMGESLNLIRQVERFRHNKYALWSVWLYANKVGSLKNFKVNFFYNSGNTLGKIRNNRIITRFLNLWRVQTKCILNSIHLCNNMFNIIMKAPLKKFFTRYWNICSSQKIAMNINQNGEKALKCMKLNQRIESINNFLNKEGLVTQSILNNSEIYIGSREGKLRQAIFRWMNLGKGKELLHRAISSWKDEVQLKVKFKSGIQILFNLINLSSIAIFFKKWKKAIKGNKKSLLGLSKEELIVKCTKQNLTREVIISNKIRLDEENNKCAEINNYLGLKAFMSKSLTLVNTKQRMKYAIRKSFCRWKENTDKILYSEMQIKITNVDSEKNQSFQNSDFLESKNNQIIVENEELRHISIDAIELAQLHKLIKQQKEELSIDLADKSLLLKKLIESNENLTEKLKKAQEEARQILQFSEKITVQN